MVFRLDHGSEIYAGLQESILTLSPDILPSEARTLAQIIRATGGVEEDRAHRNLLINALLTSAGSEGWGDTNANAEAALAITELTQESPPQKTGLEIAFGSEHQTLSPEALTQAQKLVSFYGGLTRVSAHAAVGVPTTMHVLAETTYLPAEAGSLVAASTHGFVVQRSATRIVNEVAEKLPFDKPGMHLQLAVDDVVEDSLEVVNPEDRHFIAIVMPLAAGMEPMNPVLATAPPEATPTEPLTLKPAYMAFLDDQIAYYYDELPKGTYHFAVRTRATTAGSYTQPAAFAEAMYHQGINGNSDGAAILIARANHDAATPKSQH